LSGKDIWELLSDSHYKTLIQISAKKMLDKHRNFLRDLYIKKMELNRAMRKSKTLRKEQTIHKKSLSDNKALKERFLSISQWEQAAYEKYIRNKIEIEKDLKKKQLEEQLKFEQIKDDILSAYDCEYVNVETQKDAGDFLSEECYSLNRALYAEWLLKDEKADATNFLDWPALPVNGISAYFSDEGYKAIFWADHGALDLPLNQWSDIKAAADGYPIYILPPTTSEYAYIALKHSNWFVTVYGHVNEILVEKFDFVERGQVFAKSGWAPGTKWAWFLSTGPHLHFEVFYEKELTDPLQFLDLSYLKIADVPSAYVYKHEGDFKARKWYEYDGPEPEGGIFRISGDNEIERQKNLLSKYATSQFQNWDTWVEESIEWGIDPSFVMCIWLAETGLWKSLKTPFNIGNVWNTDSWATITFPNARSGIRAMIRWLNNKYLWQYDEIRQLSRYGNKDLDKPIYASSQDHWHNNNIKCMSALKWRFVADNYNFRLQ
jgi:murein DD-endopeptidase MepM/ murein hydrolase activator NlpD